MILAAQTSGTVVEPDKAECAALLRANDMGTPVGYLPIRDDATRHAVGYRLIGTNGLLSVDLDLAPFRASALYGWADADAAAAR